MSNLYIKETLISWWDRLAGNKKSVSGLVAEYQWFEDKGRVYEEPFGLDIPEHTLAASDDFPIDNFAIYGVTEQHQPAGEPEVNLLDITQRVPAPVANGFYLGHLEAGKKYCISTNPGTVFHYIIAPEIAADKRDLLLDAGSEAIVFPWDGNEENFLFILDRTSGEEVSTSELLAANIQIVEGNSRKPGVGLQHTPPEPDSPRGIYWGFLENLTTSPEDSLLSNPNLFDHEQIKERREIFQLNTVIKTKGGGFSADFSLDRIPYMRISVHSEQPQALAYVSFHTVDGLKFGKSIALPKTESGWNTLFINPNKDFAPIPEGDTIERINFSSAANSTIRWAIEDTIASFFPIPPEQAAEGQQASTVGFNVPLRGPDRIILDDDGGWKKFSKSTKFKISSPNTYLHWIQNDSGIDGLYQYSYTWNAPNIIPSRHNFCTHFKQIHPFMPETGFWIEDMTIYIQTTHSTLQEFIDFLIQQESGDYPIWVHGETANWSEIHIHSKNGVLPRIYGPKTYFFKNSLPMGGDLRKLV